MTESRRAMSSPTLGDTDDMLTVLSALAYDVVHQQMPANQAAAVANAFGKILKAKEMQLKHGKANQGGVRSAIPLCGKAAKKK